MKIYTSKKASEPIISAIPNWIILIAVAIAVLILIYAFRTAGLAFLAKPPVTRLPI